MLFEEIVFGPIRSRRLGASLGINLLPTKQKLCNYECIYCECGFVQNIGAAQLPTRHEVSTALEAKLCDLIEKNSPLDVITFAGNGEPTLHPDFAEIVSDTIALRNRYFPKAKITVLSNATRAHLPQVRQALLAIDNNVLKLDSAIEATARLINQPNQTDFAIAKIIDEMATFENVIVQTLFFTGEYNGAKIDNTTDHEVEAWLAALHKICPQSVMIYSLDRATPAKNLQKAPESVLRQIAQRATDEGFSVQLTL